MADVKFLANLDVDGNLKLKTGAGEIHNASFQILTADPSTNNFEGRMIYRSDTNTVKFYDGSAWQSLSTTTGDITGVTAGNGLTGGGNSGAVTVNVGAGTGITVNANDIAISSGGVDTTQLADDAVTAAKLANTAVTAGSYTAADITVDAQGRITAASSGTIGTSEIANDAVTAAKLADTAVTAGSYTAADITVDAQGRITAASNGVISTSELAADAVTNAKLADDAVSNENLADTVISGHTAITSLASTDELLVYDASASDNASTTIGTLVTHMQNNLTFTTNSFRTVTAGGNTLGASETLAFTAGSNITITESGGAVTIAGTANTQLSDEEVQDIVGAMFSGNTETGITATYQDADGTIDLVVAGVSEVNISNNSDDSAKPIVFVDDSGSQALNVDGTGTNDLTYNPSTQTLSVNNITVAGTQTINNTTLINTSNGILFEGATEDAYETKLVATDPTADRTITLKNASGTLAFTSDITYTSDEQIEDIVGGMVSSNTETGITVTYQDADGTLDFVVDTATSSALGRARVAAGAGIDVSVASGVFTVSGETASASNAGIVELATAAETLAGSDSARAVTPAGLAARSYNQLIGDGSATSIAVTHNLGTRNVMVQLYDASTYENVYAEVVRTSTSVVTIDFNTAPSNDDIMVLVSKID